MRETKAKEIGDRGYSYHVIQFGAREGGRVLVRLLKMLGGVAGTAIEGATLDEKEQAETALVSIGMSTAGKMLSNFAETVSEDDFDYLIDKFAPTTSVSGGDFKGAVPLSTEGVFDLHFAGAYPELGQWLLFAIEVNFGSFLGEGGILQKAKAMANVRPVSAAKAASASKSRSPNISATSGQSGA